MKTAVRIVLVIVATMSLMVSCARDSKEIPEAKFVRIYAEMLVADAWLSDHPELREKADTSLFYESIFQKYGYTRDDFLYSLSQRVKDVEGLAKTMESVEFCINKMENEATGRKQSKRDFREKIKAEDEVIITSIE